MKSSEPEPEVPIPEPELAPLPVEPPSAPEPEAAVPEPPAFAPLPPSPVDAPVPSVPPAPALDDPAEPVAGFPRVDPSSVQFTWQPSVLTALASSQNSAPLTTPSPQYAAAVQRALQMPLNAQFS